MKYSRRILAIFITCGILFYGFYCHSADNESRSSNEISASSKEKALTPFPNTIWMQKIAKRHQFEERGWALARHGLYNEALLEFQAATDPLLLNNKGDAMFALWAIGNVYVRQGKFNEALELHEKYILPFNPKKEEYINRRIELRALVKARDVKDNKPIYDYIAYLKIKDNNRGFDPDAHVNDLIHLYDYMHDYDAGIAFMDEVIKFHAQHPNQNHRSANAKRVKEYTRVKQAWELDKKTGQHGHLQEVVRTSDVISW